MSDSDGFANSLTGGSFPTAEEIADAIVSAQRNVSGTCVAFSGTAQQSLSLPSGTIGSLKYIGDHGAGVVRVSFDGSNPVTDNYPEFNARHALNLNGVDLSLLRFNGSGNGDYTVCYEIWN